MRLKHSLIIIPVLALLAMGCGPRRPCMSHHGEPCHGGGPAMGMAHGCGPDSCTYRSRCYSNGAVQGNDGVCQACSGGKWVSAEGCHQHGCCEHGCGMMGGDGKRGKKSMPCMHGGEGGGGKRQH